MGRTFSAGQDDSFLVFFIDILVHGSWVEGKQNDSLLIIVEKIWGNHLAETAGDAVFGNYNTLHQSETILCVWSKNMNSLILTLFSEGDKLKGTTLYHLLRGKRSSSVLLYGFFHDILRFSGMYPRFSENDLIQLLAMYGKKGLLEQEEVYFFLTEKGAEANRQFLMNHTVSHMDFFRFGRSDLEIWRLIKFAVQVASHLSAEENRYVPLESDVFFSAQIKRWLSLRPKAVTISKVQQELGKIFGSMEQWQADFLANQFSGFEMAGLVSFQLAETHDKAQIFLIERDALHAFLTQLSLHEDFILHQLAKTLFAKNLNSSMLMTKSLVLKGLNFEEIVQRRGLKKGTVQDHLLEWAIQDPNFPYERFLSDGDAEYLMKLDQKAKDWSFKEVFSENAMDYLTFRLTQIKQYRKESTG